MFRWALALVFSVCALIFVRAAHAATASGPPLGVFATAELPNFPGSITPMGLTCVNSPGTGDGLALNMCGVTAQSTRLSDIIQESSQKALAAAATKIKESMNGKTKTGGDSLNVSQRVCTPIFNICANVPLGLYGYSYTAKLSDPSISFPAATFSVSRIESPDKNTVRLVLKGTNVRGSVNVDVEAGLTGFATGLLNIVRPGGDIDLSFQIGYQATVDIQLDTMTIKNVALDLKLENLDAVVFSTLFETGAAIVAGVLQGNIFAPIAVPIVLQLAEDAVTAGVKGLVEDELDKQENSTKDQIQSQLATALTASNIAAALNGFQATPVNIPGLPIPLTVGDLLTALNARVQLFTEVWDAPPAGVDAAVVGGRGIDVAASVRFSPNTAGHYISGRIEVPPSECLPRDLTNLVWIPGQMVSNTAGVVGEPCRKFFGAGPHPVRSVLGGKPSRVLGTTDPSLDWAETQTTGTWNVSGNVFEFGGKLWCRALGENVPDHGMMFFDGIETGRGAPVSQPILRGAMNGITIVADPGSVRQTSGSELSYQEFAIPNPGVGSLEDCVYKIQFDVDRSIGFVNGGIRSLFGSLGQGNPDITEISIPVPEGFRKVKVLTIDPLTTRADVGSRVWVLKVNPRRATQFRERVIRPRRSAVPSIDFPDIPLFRFRASDVLIVRPEFGTFDSELLLSELADAAALPGITRGLPDLAFPWQCDDSFVLDRVLDSVDALHFGFGAAPEWPSFVDFLSCPFLQPTSLSANDPYLARLLGEVHWARETQSQRYVPLDLQVVRLLP